MKKLSQVNEGFFSAIKTSFQITKATGETIKHFEDREKYKSIEDIKKDLKKVAKENFDKYVKTEDHIEFSEWYPGFEKSFLNELKNEE